MVFSVIIPTRNRPASLVEAIKSVMAQTYKDWELIIVDDASDVDVRAGIDPFLSERIRYFRNEKPLGPGGSRNRGIRMSHPESTFVSLLDDDDVYLPDFLAKTYEVISKTDDDIGFAWTGIQNYFPETNETKDFFWDPPFTNKEEAFCGFLVNRFIGTGYGITIKKNVFDQVGYFDETMRAVEDTDFFLRTLKTFFYVKIPDILVRITRQTSNHVNADTLDRAEALQLIFSKHRKEIIKDSKAWYNFVAKISGIYFRLGDKAKGRRVLLETIREQSSLRILWLWTRLELRNK